MAPHQDDFGIQEAIKTTLVQLCKVGVVYQSELAIAGTVGVTVDRRRTILVHFNERLDPCCQPDTSSSTVVPGPLGDSGYGGVVASSSAGSSTTLGLMALTASPPQASATLGAAYSDLTAQFTSASSSGLKNEAYSQTLPSSIPVSIDIDSDSDSLCELGFDDDVIEVDPSSMIRKKEVMWSCEEEPEVTVKEHNKTEVKSSDPESERTDTIGGRLIGTGEDSEPSSSALSPDDPSPSTLISPPRLLVDKRLFLKKMSPETPPMTTRRRSARAAAATAAATLSPSISHSELLSPSIEDYVPPDVIATIAKPRLTCEVCGKGFGTHGLLEAHLVEAHGVVYTATMGDIVHYACKHCSKKFRYRATLDKHEFLHVADKPYKCRTCSNTYCYEESLQIHMNVHAGVLDCLICQKMYSSRKHLQKHIVYMHEMRRVRNGTTPKKRLLSMEDQEDEEPSTKTS